MTHPAAVSNEAADTPSRTRERLPLGALVAYGVPAVTLGFSSGLMMLYLLKFATDVVLIPPALFASAYGMARVWDAVSDPVAGYLSDRTRHRAGRRRPWLVVGAVPLAMSFVMLWSPPESLSGDFAIWWMGGSVFFFYTAYTAVAVPHLALGAELTNDYHDRSRVFGSRGIFDYCGVLLAGITIAWFQTTDDVREAATLAAWAFALFSIPLLWQSASRLRENPAHQSRGATAPKKAFRDVARNRYARLLITVFFVENLSMSFIAALFPYITQYTLPSETEGSGVYLVIAITVAVLSFPIWFPLSRRFGKRNVWIASNAMKLAAFFMIYLVSPERLWPGLVAIFLIGPSLSAHIILAPSVKADVVDFDEHQTHERKEGSYFALWNLAVKIAGAVAIFLAGWLLQFSGYEANVAQTQDVARSIQLTFAGVPALCHVIAIVLLLRFDLDEAKHAKIRRDIDARDPASP